MKKSNIKWCAVIVRMLILSIVLVTFATGAPPQGEAAPFKIGIVTSTSGPGFGYGQRAILGIRYRIEEEINKAGGINGHPVKLITYDTRTRADQAAMLTERVATVDKVLAILGPNSSSDVAAAFPTAKRIGIPAIALGGTIRGLVEKNTPWAFSTMSSDDFMMEPVKLLIDQYNVKDMIIMVNAKYNFCVTQGNYAYKIAQEKGVKVLHKKGKLDVETGWPDYTPQVTQIKSLAPDLIVAILFPKDGAHFAMSLRRAGIDSRKLPCYASALVGGAFLVAGGESVEGWWGSMDFDPGSKDPIQVKWQQKLTAYGKSITKDKGIYTVNLNTSAGYDAAAFLCEAIRRTKITPDTPLEEARAKILDELTKIKMKTLATDISRDN